uniref:Putative salivary kunitz domain protein n=1 Tax=Ixodes ricinus TaxID=34613 RepID=A0A0K8R7P2_IXORI
MKAFIAALCFLVALSCVIATLTEEDCRRPLPFSSCAGGFWDIYSFFNNTNKCEHYPGCDKGPNRFPTLEACMNGCPFGEHSLSGKE